MASFNDFDVEVQDIKDTNPEHKNSVVTTAGTPVTVSRTDSKNMTTVFIRNPSKGTRMNDVNSVIYISITGVAPTTDGLALARGEYVVLSGNILNGNLKIDANANGVNAEIILWG